jgi:hypothetical protein
MTEYDPKIMPWLRDLVAKRRRPTREIGDQEVPDVTTLTEIPHAWRVRRPWEGELEFIRRQQQLHDEIERPYHPDAECDLPP